MPAHQLRRAGQDTRFLEWVGTLAEERDAAALIGACVEHGVNALLLDAGSLSAAFFELRSGLAGAVLQKLQNYQIRAALVVPDPEAHGERFAELAREARRGRSFGVFPTRAQAEAWLAAADP